MNYWKEKDIYFIDEYYPYWISGSNNEKIKNHYFKKGKGKYILSLKNNKKEGIEYYTNKLKSIFLYKLKNIDQVDIITYVPSSAKDKNNLAIENVLKNICDIYNNLEFKILLNRIESIEKLATGGNRNKEIHIKTIDINAPKDVKNKNIILIDDVTSTGNSMIVCKQKLEEAGAKKVICISLSKTYNSFEEACNDNKSLKALTELDNTVQNIINKFNTKKDNYNFEEIIDSIIYNFILIKESFKKYNEYIKDKYEIIIRKRELYLYLINQIKILERLDYTLDYIDKSKTLLIKIIIYKELTDEDNNLDLLSKYFEEVRLFQEKYGYELDVKEMLDNYRHLINIYLSKYTTSIHGFNGLGLSVDSSLNSIQLNYISKALYETNTEQSLRNALKIIDRAIELDKTEINLYLNRAAICIKLNKLEIAINDIKAALNLEKKTYSNIVSFGNKTIVLEWLEELNKIIDSADTNYLLAMYMYKIYAKIEHNSEDLSIIIKRGNKFKYNKSKNEKLTKNEMRILELIDRANEKSNNKYKSITKEDILRQLDIKNLNNTNHLNDNKQFIYHFPETIIDELSKEENEILNKLDDYSYEDTSGPDWLGGVESEAEFWEHT